MPGSKSTNEPPEVIWGLLEASRQGVPADKTATTWRVPLARVRQLERRFGRCNTIDELTALLDPEESRYARIFSTLFDRHPDALQTGFVWQREDIENISKELGIKTPKNLGDTIYSYRHRKELPDAILSRAPQGYAWLLLPHGRSAYRFVLAHRTFLEADQSLPVADIPDATPQIVAKYAQSDEQAVLARIRYCRLVDMFLGLASFHLQSHLRTTIAKFDGAQTELDEIYVGVDGSGRQFVIPIQAKGLKDKIGAVQVVTDHHACLEKFPTMIPRTLVAKTTAEEEVDGFGRVFTITLLEASVSDGHNVKINRQARFRIVPSAMISGEQLSKSRDSYLRGS